MLNAERIREDFPILKRKVYGKPLVYLDNAATTQKPRQVIQATNDYYETYNSNVHRAVHRLSQEATAAYDEAHEKVAGFIGAECMEEVVFTKNTTESINLVASSLSQQLQKGDEIVLTQMEHHSNIVPWQQAAKRTGAKLRFLEIDGNGELKLQHNSATSGMCNRTSSDLQLRQTIGKKTKIVAFTHVSNVLGTINPAKEIIAAAKEIGAVTVVDAAQSVPHMPVNVKELGCDFLAFSAHKMLGPTGVGVLYGKRELLEGMEPFLYGGDMISEVSLEGAKWNELPWKFEAGTPNMAGAVGLTAAVDYLQKVGMENVWEHEILLTKLALKRLQEIEGVAVYGPKDAAKRSGLVAFNLNGAHPHDVSAFLDAAGIAVRGGHHCAMPLARLLGTAGSTRASFYLYNTTQEIEKFAEALGKIAAKLKKPAQTAESWAKSDNRL
ncbi:cysteine desulfurase [Candidatus Woesearchaeota archaeon]|nr:cysteine desulfurase [Candidatus Woesearchaeota archaeon]